MFVQEVVALCLLKVATCPSFMVTSPISCVFFPPLHSYFFLLLFLASFPLLELVLFVPVINGVIGLLVRVHVAAAASGPPVHNTLPFFVCVGRWVVESADGCRWSYVCV